MNKVNNMIEDIREMVNLHEFTLTADANKAVYEQTGTRPEFIDEIIELQKTLNIKVDPNWMQSKLNWKLASLLETAEAIDSLDWKWWKKTKNDWLNLEIEMIDIFFFNLAKMIETGQEQQFKIILIQQMVIDKQEEKTIKKINRDDVLAKQVITKLSEKLVNSIMYEQSVITLVLWFDIWKSLGNNVETMLKLYKLKYTLNIFRQNNGYKEGTYIKMWDGLEDNKRALEIALNINYDENYNDNLMMSIENYYQKMLNNIKEKTFYDFLNSNEKYKVIYSSVDHVVKDMLKDISEDFYNYKKANDMYQK